MRKVLLVQPIAKEGVKLLNEEGIEIIKLKECNSINIKNKLDDIDGMLVRTAEISREIIKKGNKLKVIAGHGAGVDNIDVKAATECNIQVTNTPEANNISVVEHIIGLMLVLAKNIRKADKALRKGKYKVRDIYTGIELTGKKLGVIGLGKIGYQVANKAIKGLNMQVIGYDPYINNNEIIPSIELTSEWNKIFRESDFISLNLPLSEKTRGIIGKKEFQIMKKTAYLINCARGPIVNEKELITALKNNIIAGAGLDVYESEPPKKNNPLFSLDNTIVTPHMAAHTERAMKNMAIHSAREIIRVLNNESPKWPVNQINNN